MYEIFAKLLEKRGITPYQVFKATGVAQSSLSDWKKGKSKPKVEKMSKIADFLGISLEYLMTGKEIESDKKYDELNNVYFNFAREAQKHEIDPEDIKLAIETIRRLRNK